MTTMAGTEGNPAKFAATYAGHTWDARKVGDEISLTRTCTGCWSPRNPGMWTTRRHLVEENLTVDDVAKYAATTARIRAIGETGIADGRDANAFRII